MRVGSAARSVVASAVAAVLGCGGGGGDTPESPPSPTTNRETPLQLSSANATGAATLAFAFGTTALALGQQAVEWSDALDAADGQSLVDTCLDGGSLTVSLVDRDGNRRVSAGDQIAVNAENCYFKLSEETLTGPIAIDLSAPDSGQTLAGTITLGPQLQTPPSGGLTIRFEGALRFSYSTSRLSKQVAVTSANAPFRIVGISGQNSATEVLTQVDVRREIRRDTARVTSVMAHRLASDLLGGSVVTSTGTMWSGWYDSYPDEGLVHIAGAAGREVQVAATPAVPIDLSVRLDNAVVGSVAVRTATLGFVWSSTGWLPQDKTQRLFTTNLASTFGFRVLSVPQEQLRPNAPLVWAYSRPLSNGALNTATFTRENGGSGYIWGPAQVPAAVTVEGALITVTPTAQLEPGATYRLVFDNSTLPITDMTGATSPRPTLVSTAALTVKADARFLSVNVLMPNASVTLTGDTSTAATTHAWSHVSGPPVAFGTPDGVQTLVTALDTSTGVTVVELEVHNAAGEVDRERFSFGVNGSSAPAVVIGYRFLGSDLPLTLLTNIGQTTGYVKTFSGDTVVDAFLVGGRFLGTAPSGQTWTNGQEFDYPGQMWRLDGVFCQTVVNGHARVLDFAADAAGNVTQFAMDFEQVCDAVQYVGTIRFNSAVPLRP